MFCWVEAGEKTRRPISTRVKISARNPYLHEDIHRGYKNGGKHVVVQRTAGKDGKTPDGRCHEGNRS